MKHHAGRWEKCASGFDVLDGRVQRVTDRCGGRSCPVCGGFRREKAVRVLAGVMGRGAERAGKAKREAGRRKEAGLALVTLTTPAGAHRRSAVGALGKLLGSWGRLTNRSWWRKRAFGGYFAFEFGTKGKGYHPHMHMVLELPAGVGTGTLRRELRAQWVAAGGGRIMDVRRFEPDEGGGWAKSANELAKYLAKPIEAGPERLGEILAAVEGKHLHGYLRHWAEDRREVEAEAAAEEAEEAAAEEATAEPEPPASWLPDGRYRLADLAVPAKRGEAWALVGLAWYCWDVKRERALRARERLEAAEANVARLRGRADAEAAKRALRRSLGVPEAVA